MKKRILCAFLSAVLVLGLSAPAMAAGMDSRVLDSQGNQYTLSQPVKTTYTGTKCPYGGEAEYTVYVVEYGTKITCPNGMIFTGGLFDLEDPDARWPESYYKNGFAYAGVSSRTFKNEEKVLQCAKGTDESNMKSVPVNPSAHIHVQVVSPFTDVPYDAYYSDPVLWAMCEEITTGTSTTEFSPNRTCTRAQIITFLWRQNRSRKPTITENPFTDVQQGAYYYDACLWAYEQGIVSGTTFSPNEPCTRAMAVEFMWRKDGSLKVTNPKSFEDVPAEAPWAPAVAWAEKKGVTSGTSDTTFSPQATCTRAQIVTFMYRNVETTLGFEDIAFETEEKTIVPKTYSSPEALVGSLSERAQKNLTYDGFNVLTDATSVNAISNVGKLHQTIGYTDTVNKNGYHTEATVDVSGAVLDHEALAILNSYRAIRIISVNGGNSYNPSTMDLQWTVGDIGEETALACAKYKRCADYCGALLVKADSVEEAISKLAAQNMLTDFTSLMNMYASAAHYTDAQGNTIYAFIYMRDSDPAGHLTNAQTNYGF